MLSFETRPSRRNFVAHTSGCLALFSTGAFWGKAARAAAWTFYDGRTDKPAVLAEVELDRFVKILTAAQEAKPAAKQSGLMVRLGGMTTSGKIVIGSNHELALNDTITHGEEALIAAAADQYGASDRLRLIGFLSKYPRAPGGPCGNCRDAIQEYCAPDSLLFKGDPESKLGTFMPFSEFLFEEFKPMKDTSALTPGLLAAAKEAQGRAKMTYRPPRIPYGAAIETLSGLIRRGTFWSDAAFHSVNPLLAAVVNVRENANKLEDLIPKAVCIYSPEKAQLLYKDRQHLFELVDEIKSLGDKYQQLEVPVWIVTAKEAYRTTANEMLPHAFSALRFGMQDGLRSALSWFGTPESK